MNITTPADRLSPYLAAADHPLVCCRGTDGTLCGGSSTLIFRVSLDALGVPHWTWIAPDAAPSSAKPDLSHPAPDGGLQPWRQALAGTLAPNGSSGGWIGFLSYDLGRFIEPASSLQRFNANARPSCVAHDAPLMEWHRIDHLHPLTEPFSQHHDHLNWVTPPAPTTSSADYQRAVARTIEYIHAGDIFQANIAHELRGTFDGSPRALAAALWNQASPRHGAYIESPPDPDGTRRILASMSPELFLQFDAATRRVITKPMKGTRRAHARAELQASAKDRAELAMIIDLMRNDLGRVCTPGSIRVAAPRDIESHGSGQAALLQATGTVEGRLRPDRDLVDLLQATFPPGSVTGAPKVRAMQIIEELEGSPRGPYCGAIGLIRDSGDAIFSVAIRTAVITQPPRGPATLSYRVGAGIVADSHPEDEWRETLDKASVLTAVTDTPAASAESSRR